MKGMKIAVLGSGQWDASMAGTSKAGYDVTPIDVWKDH